MDVHLREVESYYILEVTSPFDASPESEGIRRDEENVERLVNVGSSIPSSISHYVEMWENQMMIRRVKMMRSL